VARDSVKKVAGRDPHLLGPARPYKDYHKRFTPHCPSSPSLIPASNNITMATITTPITELFGIKHPVLLAGMNVAAGPELAAAVTNAGGLGVIGGLGYTPKILRQQVRFFTANLAYKLTINADKIYQGKPERQECAIWCRPSASPSRRKCKKDKCTFRSVCFPLDSN